MPGESVPRDISTDKTIMKRRIHDERTIVKSGIFDAKTVLRKKAEAESMAVEETAGKSNLLNLGSRTIKNLCLEAGKRSGKNVQGLLAIEFKALKDLQRQVAEKHARLYEVVSQKEHWADVNLVLVQLGHAGKAEMAGERERHLQAAQYFTQRLAKRLGADFRALETVLLAEFEMRKTRQKLFEELKKALGKPFTDKYEFSMYLKGKGLPELEL